MAFYRFILPQGGVMDLDFRTDVEAAAHAAYIKARFFKL